MCLPYQKRRALLKALDLDGPAWRTPEMFEDGRRYSKRRPGSDSKAS
jgi:hypothetical protein